MNQLISTLINPRISPLSALIWGDLALGFAQLKNGKAAGITGIPAETYKVHPGLAAMAY